QTQQTLDNGWQSVVFYGSDVKAWTILAVTNSSEELRTKFETGSGRNCAILGSHQLIAFHFTVVNGTEPEDSGRDIQTVKFVCSNTFPDIPLSTLRLLDESSMTGVAHGNRFQSWSCVCNANMLITAYFFKSAMPKVHRARSANPLSGTERKYDA
uniref:BTB domain-containing protein n=1 Tax=Loa loa TaxID=7209 RepID=A0A1I7VAJ9_LOALO